MAIDLAPIAEALELPDGVELTEDNLVALVVTALKNAKGEKPAEKPPEEKPPVGDKPAEKPPMAASNNPMLQSLVRDNRRMKLDQLAREGRLTKPARDLIEKEYLTDQAISLSLNGTDDGFDKAMAIIAANPPCVPVKGEKTGVQATSTVALSHNADTGRGKSSLVADAERRAEQAKNRRR